MASFFKYKVIKYYTDSFLDYRLTWFTRNSLGMHYGYWDKGVRSHTQALERINKVISDKLKLSKEDLVLDAGSGLGGSCFWIAKNIGCKITGITITPDQVLRAKKYAIQKKLDQNVEFVEGDYTKTTFPSSSFDAILALETVCHLEDKADFYKEMFRILKPGGRLLVGEYSLSKNLSKKEENLLNKWLSGWVIPNIWSKEQHFKAIKKLGFKNTKIENYSNKTTKSAKRLYLMSLPGIPLYYLLTKLKLRNKINLGNALSCKYQWETKKKGFWDHTFFYTEKPKKASG